MDVNFDKKQVNKESFKDAAMRRRARGQVKQTLEERCVEPERCEGRGKLVTLRHFVLVPSCSLFAPCVARGVPRSCNVGGFIGERSHSLDHNHSCVYFVCCLC